MMQNFQRCGGDGFFPLGYAISKPEVGIEKESARPQHPRDARQKSREVRIPVRCLDVDDRVETVRLKRQIFRVALQEFQSVNAMTLPAKSYSGRIQIERNVTLRLQRTRQVAGAAAVAAAHFEYIFPA